MTTAPLDLFWHETDADRDTDERHSAMTLAEADARMDPLAHGRAAMQRDITEGPSALLKEQLCAIATELLLIAEKFGVTFSEVRLAAETRGLLTGHEYGRWLSCGDGLMRRARGKGGRTNGKRKSQHGNSHRRMLSVHVHEDFCK